MADICSLQGLLFLKMIYKIPYNMSMFALMEKVMNSAKTAYHRGGENPTMELENDNRCPHCKSDYIVCKELDMVCMDCYANLGADIDHGPEWRNDKNTGEDLSRCNLTRNEMLPESSLSTCVLIGPHANKAQYDLQRTMTWNSIPHHERSLRSKLDDISYTCRINDIPDGIIEYAQHQYYKLLKALEENNVTRRRGKNDAGMKAAALFFSLQDDGKPRTYKEIAKLFNIEPRYASEGINMFNEFVRPNGKVTVYSDYIDEFCRNMNLSKEIADRVTVIADRADQLGILETNTPTSFVAGCIYYVAVEHGLSIHPDHITASCCVSAPTVNKVCKKLFSRAIDLSAD